MKEAIKEESIKKEDEVIKRTWCISLDITATAKELFKLREFLTVNNINYDVKEKKTTNK